MTRRLLLRRCLPCYERCQHMCAHHVHCLALRKCTWADECTRSDSSASDVSSHPLCARVKLPAQSPASVHLLHVNTSSCSMLVWCLASVVDGRPTLKQSAKVGSIFCVYRAFWPRGRVRHFDRSSADGYFLISLLILILIKWYQNYKISFLITPNVHTIMIPHDWW